MWVLTTHGFYSAVEDPQDEDIIIVRARVREDLEKLKRLIPRMRIVDNEGTDYAFRAYVSRDHWVDALAAMGDAIDYGNFKDAVHDRQGHKRGFVYGRVWSALYALQPRRFDPFWDEEYEEWSRGQRRQRRLPGGKVAAALREAFDGARP